MSYWLDREVARRHQQETKGSSLVSLLEAAFSLDNPTRSGFVHWITDDPTEVDQNSVFVLRPSARPVDVEEALDRHPLFTVGERHQLWTPDLLIDDAAAALARLCRAHFR